MPYILYTLGAHSTKISVTLSRHAEGYGRAHAWRPRIMRVSLPQQVTQAEL